MPVYEYECRRCGERFSLLRRMSEREERVQCPHCGAQDEAKLLISAPARPACTPVG